MLCERWARFGPSVKNSNKEGGRKQPWVKRLETIRGTIFTHLARSHCSCHASHWAFSPRLIRSGSVTVAAAWIKQIYSIDITHASLQLYQRASGATRPQRMVPSSHSWGHTTRRVPLLWQSQQQSCGSGSAVPQSSEESSSEQRLCSLVFPKCWEIWKLIENVSSLSLNNITRAVKAVTAMIEKSAVPLYQKDKLTGPGSGSSFSCCSNEFLPRLTDTSIILLTLKSSGVCSFTMQIWS